MKPRVVIDCFPSSVEKYTTGYAVVAIDVIRATTSAITAVMAGRRCFPVATLADAQRMKSKLGNCLLAGELNGDVPAGFDLNNSPAELAEIDDQFLPIVLLSTSGTQLMSSSSKCDSAYVACFRNYKAVASSLLTQFKNVAVIGAGSRNEFREEDQMCCAWIAEELINAGYQTESRQTDEIVERWSGAPPEACLEGNSAKYLRRTGQLRDLEFVRQHINDVECAFVMSDDEVIPEVASVSAELESSECTEMAA
jgi:2-phosphosulfolactate phosphatase